MKTTTVHNDRKLATDPGDLAENIADREYKGFSTFGVENFDLSNSETGSLAEVKSTATDIGEDYPESGRFRLWKDQHEKLLRADRQGSAFYIFVLFAVSERPVTARLKRKNPADVGNMIGGRGGWYASGHNKGKQHKVPHAEIF